jgi:hypothetical protein
MTKKFLILFLILIAVAQAIRMKRICFLTTGPFDELCYLICYDTDHDGSNELIFSRIVATYISAWMIWEYQPLNNYELVFADTGAYPFPPGITTGNFRPYDVSDIDQDSLTDLVGTNYERVSDTLYYIVTTQENPTYYSYPDSLSWWYRFSDQTYGYAYHFTDLDQDDRREILMWEGWDSLPIVIIENIGNNQNIPVWRCVSYGSRFSFGDFDRDGQAEFITASASSLGQVFIFENTGDNQYDKTFTDTVGIPNGIDIFSGNDLDNDGKSEFFVGFTRIVDDNSWNFFLYMWEATGNNTYERTFLFSQNLNVQRTTGRRSICADIDGDSIEELIWATPINITVYEAFGNNQFQPLWQWWQDHGQNECLIVNSYDMNKNGYNEIVVGGSGKTSIFEIEAVKVLRPNGGETFVGNSQEQIRWQKFYPPRCDSLSLFYSLDNGWTYDTIITGLPSTDTSYLWTVPDTSSDSCKVKIIAYGPGWQFDESDGVFTIAPSGIEEFANHNIKYLSLKITPNLFKSQATICFTLPTAQKISLKLYDITGKIIKVIFDGHKESGIYKINLETKDLSSGIYFIHFQTELSKQIIERFAIMK